MAADRQQSFVIGFWFAMLAMASPFAVIMFWDKPEGAALGPHVIGVGLLITAAVSSTLIALIHIRHAFRPPAASQALPHKPAA
jgi:hypothetical protein